MGDEQIVELGCNDCWYDSKDGGEYCDLYKDEPKPADVIKGLVECKRRRERMMRFCYTADDAAGCTLEAPDYSICEDCIHVDKSRYNNYCNIYRNDIKPHNVGFGEKTCKYKNFPI